MQRTRETIGSQDLTPTLLELLKKRSKLVRRDIDAETLKVAESLGLRSRPEAIGAALKELEWKGWVLHQAPTYEITGKGKLKAPLTSAESLALRKGYQNRRRDVPAQSEKVLFARIGWMKRYGGSKPDDLGPRCGGKYNESARGSEICNFKIIENKTLYGFVEPPGRGKNEGVLNLDRISPGAETDSVDGVLVIFVAPGSKAEPPYEGLRIVGWYRNAIVYKLWKDDPTGERWATNPDSKRVRASYNLFARVADDAVLLPRAQHSVPRGLGGVGQKSVRYFYNANGSYSGQKWMEEAIRFVESYDGPNLLLDPVPGAELEPDDQITLTAGFESDPRARKIIEDYSMSIVERQYVSQGYSVKDCSKKESYDFYCRKGPKTILVEVKGTRGTGESILLTRKEVQKAIATLNSKDANIKMELCVVHSISLENGKPSGGTLLRYSDWNPEVHNLQPITYLCSLLLR